MSDAARTLITPLVGILLTIIGALGLLLWNNQQDVLKGMSERISLLERGCAVADMEFPV